MRIIDITQPLFIGEVYPGHPVPQMQRLHDMNNGELYNLSAFSMCVHNGTHVDAPFHFYKDGRTIDEFALEAFVGDCYVARHNGDVTAADAQSILSAAKSAGAAERILIAGEATVTADAARVFAAANLRLLGNESQAVGPVDAPMEVHRILLGAEIILLEGVRLDSVKTGVYFLSAAPLNLPEFDGSPCRAYLIEK